MKKLFTIIVACLFCGILTTSAQTYVKGYYRKDGTYVQGHYRSNKNSTNHDNYSTQGNINPFTGNVGSVAKDYSPQAENYGSGKVIYTGPRGGQYYINDKGNKTYIPKQKSKTNSNSKQRTNTLYYPW